MAAPEDTTCDDDDDDVTVVGFVVVITSCFTVEAARGAAAVTTWRKVVSTLPLERVESFLKISGLVVEVGAAAVVVGTNEASVATPVVVPKPEPAVCSCGSVSIRAEVLPGKMRVLVLAAVTGPNVDLSMDDDPGLTVVMEVVECSPEATLCCEVWSLLSAVPEDPTEVGSSNAVPLGAGGWLADVTRSSVVNCTLLAVVAACRPGVVEDENVGAGVGEPVLEVRVCAGAVTIDIDTSFFAALDTTRVVTSRADVELLLLEGAVVFTPPTVVSSNTSSWV